MDFQKDYCKDWSNNVKKAEVYNINFDWPIPEAWNAVNTQINITKIPEKEKN